MLTAFYDLSFSPVSFDFVHFLIGAQQAANGEPIHVVIVPGTNRGFRVNDHKPLVLDEKQWRVDHVLVPLARLFGCSVTVAPTREFAGQVAGESVFPAGYRFNYPRRWYTHGLAVGAIRKGFRPKFQASVRAREHIARLYGGAGSIVTMTIRATYTPTRNSRADEWVRLSEHVKAAGYTPVIIPDTATMGTDLCGGVPHCHLAALDLDVRLALYERAALNMAASGGPFVLNVFGGLPYAYFIDLDAPETFDKHGRRDWQPDERFYAQNVGLPRGSQYPGAGPSSATWWRQDTFENLRTGFDWFRERTAEAVAA